MDDNHPIGRLIPKEKRSDELEAALNGLGATDMSTLADALITGYKAKTESETLASQVAELNETMDDMVFIPDENTSEEETKLFYEKAGVPGSIVDYGIPELENNEDGKSILNAMLEAKIPKGSAAVFASKLTEVSAAEKRANEERLASLKSSLGEKGLDLAKKGAELLYPGDDKASIRERYLSDPDAVPGLAIAGRVGIEKPNVFSGPTPGGGGSLYPSMDKRGLK